MCMLVYVYSTYRSQLAYDFPMPRSQHGAVQRHEEAVSIKMTGESSDVGCVQFLS